jgi:hypothetical protein
MGTPTRILTSGPHKSCIFAGTRDPVVSENRVCFSTCRPGSCQYQLLIDFQHASNTDKSTPASQSPTTNVAQPSQPAAQVFATTELFEQILISVNNIKCLMTARQVCRRWQDMIDNTESLKNMMWLAPQQLDHEWYLSPGAIRLYKRPMNTTTATGGDVIYKSARYNPFLFRTSLTEPIWKSCYHDPWISQPLYIHEQSMASFRGARSLFLKMFATQPPVTVMYMRVQGGDSEHRSYRCLIERIKNAKGVKVGDVLRAAWHASEAEPAFVVESVMFPVAGASGISIRPWAGFGSSG